MPVEWEGVEENKNMISPPTTSSLLFIQLKETFGRCRVRLIRKLNQTSRYLLDTRNIYQIYPMLDDLVSVLRIRGSVTVQASFA